MDGEWIEVRLGDVAINHDAKREPVKESDRRPGPFPYYGASGVVDWVNGFNFDGEYVLVAEDGENLRTRRTPIAFLATSKFWVNNNAHVLSGSTRTSTRFLLYAILAADVGSFITGAVMPKLTQASLHRIPLLLPCRGEQERIVGLLGALDDKIELNRRMAETLEAIAQALFKSWFVDFDPVRARAEGRPTGLPDDLAALFPDSFDHRGKPHGWPDGQVSDLATISGGKQLSASLINSLGEVPVFGGAGPMGFTSGYNVEGWVLTFGRVGAYCGRFYWHVGRAWVNNNASLVSPRRTIDAFYLFLGMSSVDLEPIKRGAAQPFISNGDMASLKITIPVEEIRDAFAGMVSPLFSRLLVCRTENQTLATLRNTLLPKLISGELRIADAEQRVAAA